MRNANQLWKATLQALCISGVVTAASAQTVTVTTSSGALDIDFFTGTVADLPGPDGEVSFLEAIIATNHTPGHQTIGFNIPSDDWGLQFLYPGCAVITAGPNGFIATDSVTIDGTTQTAFTGDTNPDGAEVALYFPFGTFGAALGGEGSVLRGLHSAEWSISGDNALVTGNSGGMHLNVSGDFALIQGNAAGTIKIDGGSHAVVTGNTMQRVRLWGGVDNRVGGPTLAERNFITGFGSVNSEGLPSGSDVELFQTQDVVIENNYIGTTIDGMAQGHLASNIGIDVETGNEGLRVRNNLIAGVLGHGQGPHWAGTLWGWAVYFQGSGTDIEFSGNTIGLDAAGGATLPSVWGVDTSSGSYTDVRFIDNVIAGHYFNGVTVGENMPALRLAGNEIYGNATSGSGFIGIDLIGPSLSTGVTANDALDADVGGNGLQNFPVLTGAVAAGEGTMVSGDLESAPLSSYTIEFFSTANCDPTGYGQGEEVLGTLLVSTDAAGQAQFSVDLPTVPVGSFVTATATLEPVGATSEFSACVSVGEELCQPDLGFGGPGAPALSICGPVLSPGNVAQLEIVSAPANSAALIVYSTSFNPTPVLGGMLVALPAEGFVLGTTDGAGELSLAVPGSAVTVTLNVQALVSDAVSGELLLTNAVAADFMP